MTYALFVLLALLQSAGSAPSSQSTTPAAPAPVSTDPATLVFPPDVSGLVLVPVKADRTADYEAVISAVQAAMAEAGAAGQRVAAGWKVFKAQETDAKGNAVYVHFIAAPVPDLDYRPSVAIEAVAKALPEAMLVKYRDAFAGSPTRLSLGLVTDLGAPPVKPKP